MKKILSLLITLTLSTTFAFPQDCTLYIPSKVGTELHYQITNGKGKIEGKYIHKMISKTESGDQTTFEMLQTFMDPKSPDTILMQDTIRFRCKDNVFYIDMDKYLNQNQMEAFEGMEIKVVSDDLMYPPKLSPGMKLKDGSIRIEMVGGMMNMTMTTNIINRKVEAHETISTPAGDFKCYKVSEDVQSKMAFVKTKIHSVTWIAKDIGTIRSESYNKKGKLNGITELMKIIR
jgi:hypothetical protein